MKHVVSICLNIVIFAVLCSDSAEGFGFGADWSWDFLWDKLDHLKKYDYGGTRGGRLWQRSVNRGGQRRGWGRSRSGGGDVEDDSEELSQNIYMNNGGRRFVSYDREMDSKFRTPRRRFNYRRDFDPRSSSSVDVEEEEIGDVPSNGRSDNMGGAGGGGGDSPNGVELDEVPSNSDSNSGKDPPDLPSSSSGGSNAKADVEEQEGENKGKEGSKELTTEAPKVKTQSATQAPGNTSQTTERSEAGEFANGTSIGRTDVPEEIEPEDPIPKTTKPMQKFPTTKTTPPEVEVEAGGKTPQSKLVAKPAKKSKPPKAAENEIEMEHENEPSPTKKQTTASPATKAPVNIVNTGIGGTKTLVDSTKWINLYVTRSPKLPPNIPLPPPYIRPAIQRRFPPRMFVKTTMKPTIPSTPNYVSTISNTRKVTIGDNPAGSLSSLDKTSKFEKPSINVVDGIQSIISDSHKPSKIKTQLVHVVDGTKAQQQPVVKTQSSQPKATQQHLNTIKSLISKHTGGSTIVRDFIGISDTSQNNVHPNLLPNNEKAVLSLGNKDLLALMNEMANSVKTTLHEPANSKSNTDVAKEVSSRRQIDVLPAAGSISQGAQTAIAQRAKLPVNSMSLGTLDTSQNTIVVSPSKKPSLILDKIRPTLGLDNLGNNNLTLFNIADIKKDKVSVKNDLPMTNIGASTSPILEKSLHNSMNSVAITPNVVLQSGNVISQNKENHWRYLANSGLGKGLGTRRRGPGVWFGGGDSKAPGGSKLLIGSSLNNSWMAAARAGARNMAANMEGQWKSKLNI